MGAGAGTALALALLLVNWELRALAENVEVEFDDAVRHLAVEQKAVFRNGITLVVNFNGHIAVNVEVVRLLHTLYAAVFHQVVFTGAAAPRGPRLSREVDELRGALDVLPHVVWHMRWWSTRSRPREDTFFWAMTPWCATRHVQMARHEGVAATIMRGAPAACWPRCPAGHLKWG